MNLIFCTNNENKVKEIRNLLPANMSIFSLKEAGIFVDIPEPFDTLEENARTKSDFIFEKKSTNCFSEDTGLFVDALNGAPGVRSARYAGEDATDSDNVQKLLFEMKDFGKKTAHFKTVISLRYEGEQYFFEGRCAGTITEKTHGEKGFGYDPVFRPDGGTKNFAEMSMDEKSVFSHRKKAFAKLIDFLKQENGENQD